MQIAEALDLHGRQRLGRPAFLGGFAGDLVHQNIHRLGHRAEATGEVCSLTDDREVQTILRADKARNHLAGGNTNADIDLLPAQHVQHLALLQHVPCTGHRPLRCGRVTARRAKHCHNHIAHKLVDQPAVLVDHPRHRRHVLIEQRHGFLRLQVLRQLRILPDVAKQHRHAVRFAAQIHLVTHQAIGHGLVGHLVEHVAILVLKRQLLCRLVKRLRERAQLVIATHRHAHIVIALAQTLGGLIQTPHRLEEPQRNQPAHDHRRQSHQAAEHQHLRADIRLGRERFGPRVHAHFVRLRQAGRPRQRRVKDAERIAIDAHQIHPVLRLFAIRVRLQPSGHRLHCRRGNSA